VKKGIVLDNKNTASEKSASYILKISDLHKSYVHSHLGIKKVIPALKGLSFDIAENEIFSLIGLNGAGKTTTIKILLGLITPDRGSISLLGRDRIDTATKKHIGYLPEIPYYNSDFTPREILRFWGRLSGMDIPYIRKRTDEVLEYTSLSHAADNRIKGFSRGMLQRLGLAQAILSEPRLLILDEPMGGLDPRGIIDIRNLVLSLKENGITIFFTSHLISEVQKTADKVGILYDGKIIRIVRPDENLEEIFLQAIQNEDNNVRS
jgi:ABC-2 type transport system ATP-binding protein